MITADPLLVGTKIVLVDDKSDFRLWAAVPRGARRASFYCERCLRSLRAISSTPSGFSANRYQLAWPKRSGAFGRYQEFRPE
jgi:hypothetical protein